MRPIIRIGRAEMFALSPTAYQWTHYPRVIVRGIQKNLYTTGRMLPLILVGVAMLGLARRRYALAILLVVPAYYLSEDCAN